MEPYSVSILKRICLYENDIEQEPPSGDLVVYYDKQWAFRGPQYGTLQVWTSPLATFGMVWPRPNFWATRSADSFFPFATKRLRFFVFLAAKRVPENPSDQYDDILQVYQFST
ncbi:unnamed protein product [Protopolystoma xenopodis]|uniref:Uncharacterized protein n=1 Tax=Protopolystoma xenopodis TaxID=117903 RepID=A0A448XKG7_9PLAT|nr:unnamed protein product [Protopolystoma xenopodis]